MSNLFKKFVPFNFLNFIIFFKHSDFFFFSTMFKNTTSDQNYYHPIFRRFLQGLYLFLTWFKARVLYYVNNWIYTTNHKRIAVNYFWFVILSGIFGMVLATVIRLELAYPGVGIFAGDSLQYLSLATAHGVIMVFFMIIPLISGAFANFLLPTQLGVHDVAFPRLNSAAFWFLPGGLMMLGQLICVDRRYQRMNCFNIREAQSLLKKRFFVDLITSNDYHTLLDNTMIGLRYKTTDFNNIQFGGKVYANFGLSQLVSSKTFTYSNKFNETNNNFINHFFFTTIKYFTYNFLIVHNIINIIFSLVFYFQYFFLTFYSFIINIFYFQQHLKNFDLLYTIQIIYEKIMILYYNIVYYLDLYVDAEYKMIKSWDTYKMKQKYLQDLYIENMYQLYQVLEFKDLYKVFFIKLELPFVNINKNYIGIFLFKIYYNINQIFNIILFQFTNFLNNLLIFFNSFSFVYVNSMQINNRIFYFANFFENIINFLKISNDSNMQSNQRLFYHSWDLLSRGFFNYWGATINTVSHSLLLSYNNLFYVRSLRTFNTAHKNYTDFLSNWYLYIILNKDNIPVIDSINFVYNLRFLSNFFIFQVKYFLYCLNEIYFFIFNLIQIFNYIVCNFKNFFFDEIFTIQISYVSFENLDIFYTFTLKNVLQEIKLFLILIKNKFFYNTTIEFLSLLSYQNSSFSIFLDSMFRNEESLSQHRGLRFNYPVFSYDYKTGDYFPKFYKENITYLFSTFARLTGGVRTPIWFLAEDAEKYLAINIASFFDKDAVFKRKKSFFLSSRVENRSSPTFLFYNFFFTFHNNKKSKVNFYWSPFLNLTEKFENMFTHASMQDRMYTNWRQLKFTREAWRCKLLIARHQKSLFRRYVHESSIFWVIERNARDLLPGWAMITPFSSRPRFTAIGKVDIGVSAIILVLISSIISGANFLVTYRYLSTLNNRKMRDARSFFTEGIMCSSWMMIAANPMLMIGLIMLLSDRHWQTSFFDYSGGGDTILFQHMFWFFGHPEVYIVIIPTFGFVNTLFSYYLRKRISARASLLYSIYTIAFLGFFVWGHHMYMVGLSHTTRMLFSTLTVMISVPAATKLMHWCVTLVNSSFVVELPFLFMLTYVFLFVSGGISGMCVAHTGMDILFHDTFYVIGHFHVMFAGAAMFGCFGAFYFYFSAIFGVKYSRLYAYMHFTYYLLGQLLTVIPMFWLGYAGMPRRVLDYPSAFGGWHSIITAGHLLSVAGLTAFFIMIFDSLRQSKGATRTTLGIMRYNTRLNFYFYEIARISFLQQKGSHQYRYFRPTSLKLNGYYYTNYEYLETTLFSYVLLKRK